MYKTSEVFNVFYYMINFFLSILQQLKIEQDTLQVIDMAFLTILIPVAIAIFGDKKEFEVLDRNVILDHVVQAKFFLFYLGFIFLPLLFWNISFLWLRFVEIILWIVGIYFLSKILINSYYWMKGNKFSLRFNYLKNLKNIKDMEESWHSVWETEKINTQNELRFFEILSSSVEELLKNRKIMNENLKTISKVLGDFDAFINNRSIVLLMWPNGAFTKILEWHFKIWEKEYKYLIKKDKLDEWSRYSEISKTLDSIFQKVEERALKERESFFLETLKKQSEKYKRQFIESEDKSIKYYYIEFLFDIFYRVFFEVIENSPESYNIWKDCFPKEWKITKSNLTSKENVISRISLNNFLNWAQGRIWQAKEDFDKNLDDVARNLFPEVEPILWARILTFVLSRYGENRVKSVIERSWNFGYIGRVRTYSGYPEDDEEEFRRKMNEMMPSTERIEANSTFELTYLLFSNQFSKKNLEEYINNLKELKYNKESKEENKRLELLAIFDEMLIYKNSTRTKI